MGEGFRMWRGAEPPTEPEQRGERERTELSVERRRPNVVALLQVVLADEVAPPLDEQPAKVVAPRHLGRAAVGRRLAAPVDAVGADVDRVVDEDHERVASLARGVAASWPSSERRSQCQVRRSRVSRLGL